MSDHFLKEIKIQEYKCFNDFKANGFKRVNLISGKNNVGKSAFLESIFLNNRSASTLNTYICLYNIFQIRNSADHISKAFNVNDFLNDLILNLPLTDIKSNIGITSISHLKNSDSYEVNNGIEKHIYSISDLNKTTINNYNKTITCDYLCLGKESQNHVINYFSLIQYQDLEADLIKLVKELDDSVENIKIIDDSIQCKTLSNKKKSYANINSLGDGFRSFLFIIIYLFSFKNGSLLIDEIDNGIHYTILDKLWEIVLTLSKENNVQIFATTHSLECIQAYSRSAEKLNDTEITFTTLVKNKDNQIKAIVRDYDIFTSSIKDGNEVRGW